MTGLWKVETYQPQTGDVAHCQVSVFRLQVPGSNCTQSNWRGVPGLQTGPKWYLRPTPQPWAESQSSSTPKIWECEGMCERVQKAKRRLRTLTCGEREGAGRKIQSGKGKVTKGAASKSFTASDDHWEMAVGVQYLENHQELVILIFCLEQRWQWYGLPRVFWTHPYWSPCCFVRPSTYTALLTQPQKTPGLHRWPSEWSICLNLLILPISREGELLMENWKTNIKLAFLPGHESKV